MCRAEAEGQLAAGRQLKLPAAQVCCDEERQKSHLLENQTKVRPHLPHRCLCEVNNEAQSSNVRVCVCIGGGCPCVKSHADIPSC